VASDDDVSDECEPDEEALEKERTNPGMGKQALQKERTNPGMGERVAPGFVNPWREHRPVPPLPGDKARVTRVARGSAPVPFEREDSSAIEDEFFNAGDELDADAEESLVRWWHRLFRR
jgi:hypothetical protein